MQNLPIETRKRILAISELSYPHSVLADKDLHEFLKRQKARTEANRLKQNLQEK